MIALHIPADSLTRRAMAVSALMMAYQVAGKAVRDGFFLSQFGAERLPRMVMLAAAVAVLSGLMSSRLQNRLGPARVVPALFAVSGLAQTGEWLLMIHRPAIAAVVVYLHIVSLGVIVLSGFWSLIGEQFDPRTAKKRFGPIAGMGTLGGIAGGITAERVAAMLSTSALLLVLAALHLVCAGILYTIGKKPASRPAISSNAGVAAPGMMSAAPYLWGLATLVLAAAASEAALDYVFKSQASATIGRGENLLRFFAAFYTGTAVLTFLLQTIVTRPSLEKMGLARTVAALPISLAGGSAAALAIPGFGVLALVRGVELLLRGSLFRSAYELFYTPVPPLEKRKAKSLIDVGADRLGDAVGAGVVQALLVLAPARAATGALIAAAALAGVGLAVTLRLQRGYVRVLESSLLRRAVELDSADLEDLTTRSVFLKVSAPHGIVHVDHSPNEPRKPERRNLDPTIERLRDLRSGDTEKVRAALAEPVQAAWIPQIIALLAWDALRAAAHAALARAGPAISGQLTDALIDPAQDFAIRRRIPKVLAAWASPRAVDGLLHGLDDTRFEVRFQCARALDSIVQHSPELAPPSGVVYRAVERELAVSRTVWESYRLLDRREESDFLDDVLRERAQESLEHVFSLLALTLPREPLKVAFRALHTDDPMLRGLALEYLDSSLPEPVRARLTPIIDAAPAKEHRSAANVMDELLRSNQSVVNRLAERRHS